MNRELLLQRYGRLREFSKLVFHRIDEAAVRTFSASIAYHAILALVSFWSVVLFIVQIRLGDDQLGSRTGHRIPKDLQAAASAQAERIEDLNSTGVVVLSVIGVLAGLYGLASGFAALFDALNRIHGTHHYASMVIRYARALVVAICFTSAFTFALVIVAASTAAGKEFFDTLGLHVIGLLASGFFLFLVVLIFVPILFTLLLRYGSRARPPFVQCAAAGTVSGWGTLLFSLGFLAFINLAEPYRLYGALGTALVILVFAYWASYLMLSSVIFAEEFAMYSRIGYGRVREAWEQRDRSLTWRERIRKHRHQRKVGG